MKNDKKYINITPLKDRVIIHHLQSDKEQVKGGIIIPNSSKEKAKEAKVISLGKEVDDSLKVGDIVIVNKYSGVELEFNCKDYVIIKQDEILAVINN